MKFVSVWARTVAENVTLKVAASLLAVVAVFQLIAIIMLSGRGTIVVERSCFSKTIRSASQKHTNEEIQSFLTEALPLRFSTNENGKLYLSPEQAVAKTREEEVMKAKQITQKFVFIEATISDKEIIATGDRIISLGNSKSALPLKVKVTIAATARSEANPYGLILTEVSQIEEKN